MIKGIFKMSKKYYFATFLFFSFFLLGYVAANITEPLGFGDRERYLEMALVPENFVGSPWGYRIGVPFLVHFISAQLSVSVETVYSFAQHFMLALFLTILFFWFSARLRIQKISSILICLMFVFSYPGIYYLHNFTHIGFFEYLFILLGALAVYYNKFLFLCCVIFISGFFKESIGLILIPSFFVSSIYFAKGERVVLKCITLGIIYFSVFFFLRSGLMFFGNNGINSYASFYSAQTLVDVYEYYGGFLGALKTIAGVFGPILMLAFFGFWFSDLKQKFLISIPLFASMQILLASDVGRMVSLGMPVLLLFSAISLDKVTVYRSVVVVFIYGVYFMGMDYRIYGDSRALMSAWFGSSMIVTFLVLWFDPNFRSTFKYHTNNNFKIANSGH